MGKLIDNIFIITDCEDAIRSAIKNCLSEYNLSLYRCWKHLWAAIEAWIRSRFTLTLFIIKIINLNILEVIKEWMLILRFTQQV